MLRSLLQSMVSSHAIAGITAIFFAADACGTSLQARRLSSEALVDQVIKNAVAGKTQKALIVAIFEKGEIRYVRGIGNTGSGQVPNLDSVFYIGSLSKALTGFGLMTLVDKGKLDLDQNAGKYLPTLPGDWGSIPLLNYCTHTSGIPEVPKSRSFEAALQKGSEKPSLFPAGTSQSYNNFNFAVVGRAIETASGQPYVKFMTDSVFTPAGMRSTGVGITYRLVQIEKYPDIEPYGVPSGGLESSARDLMSWFAYMSQQAGMNSASYRAMYTPLVPTVEKRNAPWHFTPGWQARFANGDEIVAKDGGVVGFESMMQMIPSKGICIVILESHDGEGRTTTHLWPLAAHILHRLYGYPTPTEEIP